MTRFWLSGFLLLGILLGMLGSLLVVWQYHIDVDANLIGLHFLVFDAGYVIAAGALHRFSARLAMDRMLMAACGSAFVSLLLLLLASPPAAVAWRLSAIAAVGLSAGALGTSLCHCAARLLIEAAGATVTRAGFLLGSGCGLATLVIAAMYSTGSAQLETALLALAPLVFLAILWRKTESRDPNALRITKQNSPDTASDLRSIATTLFGLSLFLQFGNEWVIAGWLPLFLVRRLGSNPAMAIAILALYFAALTVGGPLAQKLLPHLAQRRYLIASVALSTGGLLLLGLAGSLLGAAIAVLVIAAGYAPICPLIAGQLDDRFSLHPGLYKWALTIAVAGAMSEPWLIGFVAGWLGMNYILLLPAFGSVLVLVFSLLLMFEAHLMADTPIQLPTPPIRNAR